MDPDLSVDLRGIVIFWQIRFRDEGRHFRSTGGEVVPTGIGVFSEGIRRGTTSGRSAGVRNLFTRRVPEVVD